MANTTNPKAPNDPCDNCGHPRELHDATGCHYLHPHSGACGSHNGQPPYGKGNLERCAVFDEPRLVHE